jgi:hypothetical protein
MWAQDRIFYLNLLRQLARFLLMFLVSVPKKGSGSVQKFTDFFTKTFSFWWFGIHVN